MSTASVLANAPDIIADDYCVFGLAVCFLKEEGEFKQVSVVEPIPSAAIEAIVKGIPTSYKLASAHPISTVISGDDLKLPPDFPSDTQFCENFVERVAAAVRTYKIRPEAQQHIPLGTQKDDLNFSLERKRVLNAINVVSKDDNVKQHSHTHKVL